jgi:hypothetical protein
MVLGLKQTEGQGGASGVLRDVVQLTGSGAVAILAEIDGTVRTGDLAQLPGGPPTATGREALLPLNGTRISFAGGDG